MRIKNVSFTLGMLTFLLLAGGCETNNESKETTENNNIIEENMEEAENNQESYLESENENTNNQINNNQDNNNEIVTNEMNNNETNEKDEIVESVSEASENLDELSVHFIDVGQADATLFNFTYEDEEYTVLFDTGNWNRNDVKTYIKSQDIHSIDVLIGSHPHADHIGQMDLIIHEFNIDEIWMSGDIASSQTFDRVLDAIESSDADYDEPRSGDEFQVGPLTIEFFNPESLTGDLHEGSLSAKFSYGEVSFLLTGDAESQTERAMINRGHDLQSDVLQLGHHGSDTSTTSEFLEAVSPEKAVISAGANNSYGHPHDSVVDRVVQADVTLYSTVDHGTIIMETKGKDINTLTSSEGTISPSSTSGQGSSDPTNSSSETSEESDDYSSNETTAPSHCININDASLEDLQEITHIGPARAEELIELRPFDSVEDLERVNGIAAGRLADIISEAKACVGGSNE
ncbi:MBL fold metallo-hydrolase [Salipaludibacillus daqingensis]|uniref:MBL fold metallo-hydrolase n=1 Tax=Salipaludibacillus daqingensis TaxID=3041001 RepID=UPI002476108A|nr:MBL fold metallo-hydrolase [Salipaludibacillus daqingensis]